jgi:integrase
VEHLYKRGEVYWCWFYDARGICRRRSTKCRDRRAAAAVLFRLERQAQGATDPATDAASYTVDDAVNDFAEHGTLDVAPQTVRMYEERGGHLVRVLGPLDVYQIDLATVGKYIKQRLDEGAARETVRKELVTLRRSFDFAKGAGKYIGDVRALIPKFRVTYVPRTRWLREGEFRKLIAELDPHRQMWLLMAVYTGGRDSEIDALEWQHVDWSRRTVLLPGTKTAKARRLVPLHPVLSQVLAKSRQASGHIVGEWMNIRRDLERACDRAKIDPVTPNDLRRTYASWMKNAGVDSAVVAKLLGHASTKMVDLVYGRLDEATLQRAALTLPGGDCEAGVMHADAKGANGGQGGQVQERVDSLSSVLGPGIEPGTRGFSVRRSAAPDVRIEKRKEQRKADCSVDCEAGVPRLRVVR